MMNRFAILLATLTLGGAVFQFVPAAERAGDWDISGMALLANDVEGTRFVIVHDNKSVTDGKVGRRCGILNAPPSGAPTFQALTWQGPIAKDLEGIVRLPGTKDEFLAIGGGSADNDEGMLYRIRVDVSRGIATVGKPIDDIVRRKVKGADYEAVAFYQEKGKTAILWGDRGGDGRPGTIYWGDFDLTKNRIDKVESVKFQSPWPTASDARSISDLKVDDAGNLYISTASDPGDTGPFASAVYVAGNIRRHDKGWTVRLANHPVPIRKLTDHKIEALELVTGAGGGVWVGTDDESFGGYLLRD